MQQVSFFPPVFCCLWVGEHTVWPIDFMTSPVTYKKILDLRYCGGQMGLLVVQAIHQVKAQDSC